MASLTPPAVSVSPLIKTARWGLLILGITYGYKHNRTLAAREDKLREEEAKRKVIRDQQLAAEKGRLAKAEMDEIGKQAGILDLAKQAGIRE
ncbi:unnamed protein product [Notodromas monacha]|uniref:ATP synthase F(0) complex subunit e, mitochondrial n=1 Tax=Notodromas monacha TaxID=399045 RepID=A0A7R9BJQ0_9CRUS|nr:unnamed protein product [Notodromas monacha]CAG0916481.1 unnamed protein product [Notodromas monacha]